MKFKVMRSMISVGLLSATAMIVAFSIQVPAQAAKLTGYFDWDTDKQNAEKDRFTGRATFIIDKHSETGMITFSDLKIDDNLLPLPKPKFDITSPMFGEEWELEMFEFKNNIGTGKIDFMTNIASFDLIDSPILTPPVTIDNVTVCKCTIPEPDKYGSLSQNSILTALMKPISASASVVLSVFEQPAHAQVTDVCPPCPVPEPTSIFGLLPLGTLGAASTIKRKLKSSKSVE